MLPIEPVLDEISRIYSKENYVNVDVPGAAFIEVLKSLPHRDGPFQQKMGPGSTVSPAQEMESFLPDSTGTDTTLVITPAMQTASPESNQGQPSKVSSEGGDLSSPEINVLSAIEELRIPISSGELQPPNIVAPIALEGALPTSVQPPFSTWVTREIIFKRLFKWVRVLGTKVRWRRILNFLTLVLSSCALWGGLIYGLYRLGSDNSIPVYGRVLAIIGIVFLPGVVVSVYQWRHMKRRLEY
jgi:hypothetical protein